MNVKHSSRSTVVVSYLITLLSKGERKEGEREESDKTKVTRCITSPINAGIFCGHHSQLSVVPQTTLWAWPNDKAFGSWSFSLKSLCLTRWSSAAPNLLWAGYRSKSRKFQGYGLSTLPASFSVPGVKLLFSSAKSISFTGVLPDGVLECSAFGIPGTEQGN